MFDWDEFNEDHLAEHGVSPEEAEEALEDPHRQRGPSYNTPTEKRRSYYGATVDGRILFVVVTQRDERLRVLSARDADAQGKKQYRKRGK